MQQSGFCRISWNFQQIHCEFPRWNVLSLEEHFPSKKVFSGKCLDSHFCIFFKKKKKQQQKTVKQLVEMQLTYHKIHFLKCAAQCFSIPRELHTHHYSLVSGNGHHSNKKTHTHQQSLPALAPAPGSRGLTFCACGLACFGHFV